MDNHNEVEGLLKEISIIKSKIRPKQIKRLKLDLLENIIKRVANYSENCDECKEYFNSIKDVMEKLKRDITALEKNDYQKYQKKVRTVAEHLSKQHGLITEGYYMNIYVSMGLVIGIGVGVSLDNTGLGVAFGLCIGLAIGSMLDAKAKKEGRVI
jgi:hypothetical protein